MAAATLTAILDDLNDYSDYEEVASVSRAKSYVTAARRFLQLPSTSSEQGSAAGYSPQLIQEEIRLARAYIRANDTTVNTGNTYVRVLGVNGDFR